MTEARVSAQSLRVRRLLVFGLSLLASKASAFEGRYIAGSKSYEQEIQISKRADGRFDVRGEVATSGCVGTVEAVGAAIGDTLNAQAKSDVDVCVLTLRHVKQGLRVDEDHCLSFHGSACEFSGDYRKR